MNSSNIPRNNDERSQSNRPNQTTNECTNEERNNMSSNNNNEAINKRCPTQSDNTIVNGTIGKKGIQWMFFRLGIKIRNCSEVASPGPSGYFNQVAAESRLQENNPSWPVDNTSYELERIIGYGATARVYEATCKSNGLKCAVKKIYLDTDQISFTNLWKETLVMKLCNHINIMSCYASFVYRRNLWLVLGFMNGGSVLDIIKHCAEKFDCTSGILDEKLIASILKQVVKGLTYIHNHGIVHRDIKAGNILYNSQGCIKIADFGVSTHLASSNDRRNSFIGTPCWMAPEVIQQDEGYNMKVDIWSLGITTIEMATGKVPNQNDASLEIMIKRLRNPPPTLDTVAEHPGQYSKYSGVFKKFINSCLRKEPELRAHASDLLKSSLLKNAGNECYISHELINKIMPPRLDRNLHPFFDKNFKDKTKEANNCIWEFLSES